MDKILKVWEHVNNMTYSKEDTIIKELKDNLSFNSLIIDSCSFIFNS